MRTDQQKRIRQDDLTPELMAERYPGLELMFQAAPDYAYYHKKGGEL